MGPSLSVSDGVPVHAPDGLHLDRGPADKGLIGYIQLRAVHVPLDHWHSHLLLEQPLHNLAGDALQYSGARQEG